MEILIPQNASMPVEEFKTFTTGRDNQDTVRVKIFQGEDRIASNNELIGELVLDGIQPAPRGTPKIEVHFEIDPDGLVKVQATDLETGNAKTVKLSISGGMDISQVSQASDAASNISLL